MHVHTAIARITGETIDCVEDECRDITIGCQQNDEECIINCLDPSSCFASNVDCNANTTCIINCIDENACLKTKIKCPITANCVINGLSFNSLTQAIIQCPTDDVSNCETNCNSTTSCHNTLIDGKFSNQLLLNCNDVNSCLDFTIYCPQHNIIDAINIPSCIIQGKSNSFNLRLLYSTLDNFASALRILYHLFSNSGDDGSQHQNLQIFAVNGLYDININEYFSDVGSESVLFCGANYTESCIIDNGFNCINASSPCYLSATTTTLSPTMHPTNIPTTTNPPTLYPSDSPILIATARPSTQPTVIHTTSITLEIEEEIVELNKTVVIVDINHDESMDYIKTTNDHDEDAHFYDAPQLVLDGYDAIYLLIFGIIWCIIFAVIAVCVFLNCSCNYNCDGCKKKMVKPKKREYGQVVIVES